jgi:hydroxymethylpyrimidine kinase/phosphomethylpyrimidine kinase/thiamine-phosphate diphosphorylase
MTENIKKKPIIWTISGSDCSGGAGIAADIKTGHGLGVEVCHLITANTVQNSSKLISVNPIPIDILQQQFEVLIADKSPSVIKIGLVANVEQVVWLRQIVIHAKQDNKNLVVVYDPVGQASVGGSFSAITLVQLTPLLREVDVITPNIMEAKSLASYDDSTAISDDNYAVTAGVETLAKKIYHDFAITSIIVKGGHSDNEDGLSSDFCYHQLNQLSDEKQDNQEKLHQVIRYQLSSPRIATHYSHGGGCSFATALASFLALGYLVRDAFTLTKAFINQGLSATAELSTKQQHSYYGAFEQPTVAMKASDFPRVVDDLSLQYHDLTAFASLDLQGEKLALYPVIDSLYWLKRLLPLGLKIIQLRVKNLAPDELEQAVIEAVELAKDYDTRLFINDYWQLAIKHGAYGVHIGQEDLQDADLTAIQKAGVRLGISTHGCYEFLLAQQLQPSYLAIGAIFPTKTKDMTGQIQGLDNLKQVLSLRPENKALQIPVVAIGGITLERADKVLATGVDSIAVVTAITEAESSHKISPEQAVDKFQGKLINPC